MSFKSKIKKAFSREGLLNIWKIFLDTFASLAFTGLLITLVAAIGLILEYLIKLFR